MNRIFEPPVGTRLDKAFEDAWDIAVDEKRPVALRLGFVACVVDGTKTPAELLLDLMEYQLECVGHDRTPTILEFTTRGVAVPVGKANAIHSIHFEVTAGPTEVCPACVGCS